MKIKLKNYAFGVLCLGVLASCNKSNENVTPQEGYLSTTNKSESFDWANDEHFETPLFHMHFSADVSQEERKKLFKKGFKTFRRENKELFNDNTSRGKATEWFFRLDILSGSQTNNETDGSVKGKITYKTDIGTYVNNWRILDNPGDDRAGGWDHYLFRGFISGKAVEWIKLRKQELALKGTDGWFPIRSVTYLVPSDQNIPATGGSIMIEDIEEWLDSPTSSQWDYWSSGTDYSTSKIEF